MDILQHGWGQIGLVILLQLLYLELSTVDCFAWHSPSETRSQTVPAQTHVISQRWPQSVPKWYPYNMWKKRKRKDSESGDLTVDNTKRRRSLGGKFGDYMSKYQRLLDKLSRKKVVNSILRNDKWKHEGQSTMYGMSFHPPSNPVLSTAKAPEESVGYVSRNHKSHFGNIGSVKGSFSSVKSDEDGKLSEEKKKVIKSEDSGFSSDGFGKTLSDGFGNDDGFQPTKPDDDFSDGFLSTSSARSGKVQHEADTAAKTSTGFGTASFASDAGSWGDSSWSDSGASWGGDGFGAVESGAADTGSWGEPAQESGGFTSIGGGAFSEDTRDCDTILTKSCADNSECSCYGFYTCSGQRCQPIQSSGTSGMGGQWQDGPANFGFSKRRDPGKVIQIFMLPWQPQK